MEITSVLKDEFICWQDSRLSAVDLFQKTVSKWAADDTPDINTDDFVQAEDSASQVSNTTSVSSIRAKLIERKAKLDTQQKLSKGTAALRRRK